MKQNVFFKKCFLIFAICMFSFSVSAEENNFFVRIKKQGKLVVAVYGGEYYPFFMKDKAQEYYGLDIDIAKDIAEKLGVELVINNNAKTFNEVVDLVSEKKADIGISALSVTLPRAQKVLFSNPYVVLRPAMIVNRLALAQKGASPQKLLEEGKGKLSVIESSSHIDIAKQLFPKAEIIPFAKDTLAAKAAREKQVLAYLGDEVFALYFLKTNPEESIYLKSEVIENVKDEIAIAVNFDDYMFKEWLDIYIRNNPPENKLDVLFSTYLMP